LYIFIFSRNFRRERLLQHGLFCDEQDTRTLGNDFDKIINGEESRKGTWPFIVRFAKGSQPHICGGTYLGRGWVLTSAHCFRRDRKSPLEPVKVMKSYFGDFFQGGRFEENQEAFILKPTKAIAHEFADLALLKFDERRLNRKINQGGGAAYVRRACIPDKHIEMHSGHECWIAGWGMTHPKNMFSVSKKLLEAPVDVMSAEYCGKHSGYTIGPGYFDGSDNPNAFEVDYPREFCAGTLDRDGNGKTDADRDACMGDSGGPLICAVDGKPLLYGVVARGESCGLANFPGIYVSTVAFREWITQTTNGEVEIMKIDNSKPKPETTEKPVVTEKEPVTDDSVTEEPTNLPPVEQNFVFGNVEYGKLGESVEPEKLKAVVKQNIGGVFRDLYPKWTDSKIKIQTDKFTSFVGKMLDTCTAKFACSAVANEKMSLSSNLDDLGKMRFYLISVLDEVKTQWYKNADTKTAKKGQNFHNKIKNFTNRLLNFANRFYVGKNVF